MWNWLISTWRGLTWSDYMMLTKHFLGSTGLSLSLPTKLKRNDEHYYLPSVMYLARGPRNPFQLRVNQSSLCGQQSSQWHLSASPSTYRTT